MREESECRKRTPVELLRAAIEEQKCEIPCGTLHELHGDRQNICDDRNCYECKIDALRKAADLVEAELDALKARALPEGMEWILEAWPKWSNGEYCKFGDWWTADKYGDYEPKQLRGLVFYTPEQLREWEQDEGDNFGYEWDFMRPSDTKYRPDKAEPPAPKVLDADGVEIRVGDTVYVLGFGEPLTVKGFTDDGRVLMSFHDENSLGYKPSKLTHEQPETWERLEEDADKNPFDYCKDVGHRLDTCENSEAYKARDLVRRAKKLAGVEA